MSTAEMDTPYLYCSDFCEKVDLPAMEKDLNVRYKVGWRVFRNGIEINENARVNYAFIAPRDNSRITCLSDSLLVSIPFEADISYMHKKMAFGRVYRQDTLFEDVPIDLLISLKPIAGQSEPVIQTQLQMEANDHPAFEKLRGIDLWGLEGKPVIDLKRIFQRHYKP